MILTTAKSHFASDIARARALLVASATLSPSLVSDDILRSALMMAVGACDAYFSDAYADLIARTLRAKDLQPRVQLPDRLNNLKVPVIAIIRNSPSWRWRMAARELIETENVLSLEKIRKLFNHFFRKGQYMMHEDTIEGWILHNSSQQRLFGISRTAYRRLAPHARQAQKKSAVNALTTRFDSIFQRRHDCIHNCDRPKTALQLIKADQARKIIDDVEFFVNRCHDAMSTEFPLYLKAKGFSGTTRSRVLV